RGRRGASCSPPAGTSLPERATGTGRACRDEQGRRTGGGVGDGIALGAAANEDDQIRLLCPIASSETAIAVHRVQPGGGSPGRGVMRSTWPTALVDLARRPSPRERPPHEKPDRH